MNNDEKLAALTNEPIVVELGEDGKKIILKRPTIKAYRKIRSYITEKGLDNKRPSSEEAFEFGVFFVATLLKEPQMTQDELEDIMLLTDLEKLAPVMEKMGFKKPQQLPTELAENPEENPVAEPATLTGADSTPA